MNVLRLVPLVLSLTACSAVNAPISPHRIDVQQGNVLDQEAVGKLKLGMSPSQVRFLLGTPLVVDPFHSNRWDYVYNYRTSGKLTEKKHLTLVFDGDTLVRIDGAVGDLAISSELPRPASAKAATEKSSLPVATPATPAADVVAAPLLTTAAPGEPRARDTGAERSLRQTSIVPSSRQAAPPPAKPGAVSDRPPEPVTLQADANIEGVKADGMPAFADGSAASQAPDKPVLAAVDAWAQAWRAKDQDAYVASYASGFRPQGGLSRAEWEKRRRLLLGLSRNIDLKIESASAEMQGDKKAVVTFNQYYRSDTYQDAVIKQLKFALEAGRWLIEEEKVLGPLRIEK